VTDPGSGSEATRAGGTGPRAGTPGGSWRVGAVVDRWRLVGLLGAGAMGQVWRVEDVESGAQAALKTVLSGASPQVIERLRREGEALARIPVHPGVLRVRAAGETHGQVWLVLDLAQGGSLQARLKVQGPLEPVAAARLVAEVARAVAHIHAHGVLHRDLKAGNVLFDGDGRALLADFGVARLRGAERLTQTGAVVGSPGMMAPEQAGGDARIDERTDVYGLGALLFECLTDRSPFTGDSAMAVLTRVLRDPPVPPSSLRPGIPPAIDQAVLAALAKSPDERPPSAKAYAELLERSARGLMSTASSGVGPAAVQAARANAARRAFLGAMVAISLVATVVTSLVLIRARPPVEVPPPPPTEAPAPPVPPTEAKAPVLTGPWAVRAGTRVAYGLRFEECNEIGDPAMPSIRKEYSMTVDLALVAGPAGDGATPFEARLSDGRFVMMGAEPGSGWLPGDPFTVVIEPGGRVRSVSGLDALRPKALATEVVGNTLDPADPDGFTLHRVVRGFLDDRFMARTLELFFHPVAPWRPKPDLERTFDLPNQPPDPTRHLLPALFIGDYPGQLLTLQSQGKRPGDGERITCELRLARPSVGGRTERAAIFEFADYDTPTTGRLDSIAIWEAEARR
jgi:hypothetical protein